MDDLDYELEDERLLRVDDETDPSSSLYEYYYGNNNVDNELGQNLIPFSLSDKLLIAILAVCIAGIIMIRLLYY